MDGRCPELGFQLDASLRWTGIGVVVDGRLTDTRGTDRAAMLVFALPVNATGWTWNDDIRGRRVIAGTEYAQVTVDCGTTGTLSAYPVAAIHDDRSGLALALDASLPAQYRLVYHAGRGSS